MKLRFSIVALMVSLSMANLAIAQTLIKPRGELWVGGQQTARQPYEVMNTFNRPNPPEGGFFWFNWQNPGDIGIEDYVADLSQFGTPNAPAFEMSTFRFVGGVELPGGTLEFRFYDQTQNVANAFAVTLPQGGNFIWTITLDPGFVVPSAGLVEMYLDPVLNPLNRASWFFSDERNVITGASPGNPDGLPNVNGLPSNYAFQMEATAAIPEPGTAVILGLGLLAGFAVTGRRRRV